jgi:NAD(P)-dependent dehydrogenase (short-subunit alcohol dehydrogenase family)
MKQCLITGGGSKFGESLTQQLLEHGYYVHLITSNPTKWQNVNNVTTIYVNWKSITLAELKLLLPKVDVLDLVFFNHNASALSQSKFQRKQLQNIKDWQQSYFVSCQLPYYLVQALSNKLQHNTKVVWMLSKLIVNPIDSEVGYSDYVGNKFTNACIMKSFAQVYPACFLGVHPDELAEKNSLEKSLSIVKLLDRSVDELNGKIFSATGTELNFNHTKNDTLEFK